MLCNLNYKQQIDKHTIDLVNVIFSLTLIFMAENHCFEMKKALVEYLHSLHCISGLKSQTQYQFYQLTESTFNKTIHSLNIFHTIIIICLIYSLGGHSLSLPIPPLTNV